MSRIIFTVFCVALTLLVSYLLGCFNGAVVISHFIIKDDVRSHGSGNAGLTNFYRTYGAKYALGVIALDMGKTVVAGLIGGYLFYFLRQDWTLGLLLAGVGCELGHMFPAFYGFKGGKGILCGGTLAWMLGWKVSIPAKHFVGRYGGDEFMAVIYDATRESITEILTELQNEVEQFNGYGTQFRISYSHRLALSTDYNECTLRTLFDKADKYMYENKQQSKQGRQN